MIEKWAIKVATLLGFNVTKVKRVRTLPGFTQILEFIEISRQSVRCEHGRSLTGYCEDSVLTKGLSDRGLYLERQAKILAHDSRTVLQERHPVPSNFRRLLTSKLKALALSGKLIKVCGRSFGIDSRNLCFIDTFVHC